MASPVSWLLVAKRKVVRCALAVPFPIRIPWVVFKGKQMKLLEDMGRDAQQIKVTNLL